MILKLFLLSIAASGTALFSSLQPGTLKESMKRGEEVYTANCAACHMPQGEGLEGVYPPLAKTIYLKNQKRAIGIILNGQTETITVNGKEYSAPMAGLPQLTDQQVADVLNYISNSWGNKYPAVKAAQVKAERK